MRVDSSAGPDSFLAAWQPFGHMVATGLGSAVALLSLFVDAPVRVACLRGAIAWASILLLTRVGGWLFARTWTEPRPPADGRPDAEGGETEEGSRAA